MHHPHRLFTGRLVCPYLGQNPVPPHDDRESRDAPDSIKQEGAISDQNSFMCRNGWAACRIVFQRICQGTRGRSFGRVPRTAIQKWRHPSGLRTSWGFRLFARATNACQWRSSPGKQRRIGICPRLPEITKEKSWVWSNEAASVGGLFHFKPSVLCRLLGWMRTWRGQPISVQNDPMRTWVLGYRAGALGSD